MKRQRMLSCGFASRLMNAGISGAHFVVRAFSQGAPCSNGLEVLQVEAIGPRYYLWARGVFWWLFLRRYSLAAGGSSLNFWAGLSWVGVRPATFFFYLFCSWRFLFFVFIEDR